MAWRLGAPAGYQCKRQGLVRPGSRSCIVSLPLHSSSLSHSRNPDLGYHLLVEGMSREGWAGCSGLLWKCFAGAEKAAHTRSAHIPGSPSFPLLSGPFSHLPGLRRLPSAPNLNYRLPLKVNLDATCVPLKPFPPGTCILSLCIPYFTALTSRVSSAALG